MATNFDIASFNLTSWANAQAQLNSGNPMNVTIPMKDENGNIVNVTVPNRGMFQKRVWDDVGGALGQFNRTFYVDSENGDDNNDGSSGNPFKSVKKAINSIPTGGVGNIRLKNNQTHRIVRRINVYNKIFIINSWSSTSTPGRPDDDSPILLFDVDDDKKVIGILNLFKSVVQLGGYYYPIKVNIGDINSSDVTGFAFRGDIVPLSTGWQATETNSKIVFVHCDLNIADKSYISSYIEQVRFREVRIKKYTDNTDNYPFLSANGVVLNISFSSGSIKNSNDDTIVLPDCVAGVVKDSNGVPRNIVSNIVF